MVEGTEPLVEGGGDGVIPMVTIQVNSAFLLFFSTVVHERHNGWCCL